MHQSIYVYATILMRFQLSALNDLKTIELHVVT